MLGLAGSPRRRGNTEQLLDQALAGAAEAGARVEKLLLNRLHVRPCQACDGCAHTGVCIIDDDIQPIHQKLREADRLILATPIFFMSLPAQAKLVIDRCQALWAEKYLLGVRRPSARDGSRRRGLWLATSGKGVGRPPHDFFDPARRVVKVFFACCDVEFGEEVLYPGMDQLGAISQHPTALEEAHQAGKRLVGG